MKKYIVCENLRSVHNIGSIIRTADALGWSVILSGYSAGIDHPKMHKTALGAEHSIEVLQFGSRSDTLDFLKIHNIYTICAEITDEATDLAQRDISTAGECDIAVIVGNEVTGVEQLSISQANISLYIDMLGTKESLNVCQAASIFMRHINILSHVYI